jgi:plasmid stability protein
MGQILVRNLDDQLIKRLKEKAKREGLSLEQTARDALAAATATRSREELIALAADMRGRTAKRKPKLDIVAAIRYDRDNDHGREWL